MEVVKLKSSSGIAKLTGVALCLAGVFVIAFYAGPSLNPVNHHRAFASHAAGSNADDGTRVAWIKGTFLMVLANMTWSLWIVLQVTSVILNWLSMTLQASHDSLSSISQNFTCVRTV